TACDSRFPPRPAQRSQMPRVRVDATDRRGTASHPTSSETVRPRPLTISPEPSGTEARLAHHHADPDMGWRPPAGLATCRPTGHILSGTTAGVPSMRHSSTTCKECRSLGDLSRCFERLDYIREFTRFDRDPLSLRGPPVALFVAPLPLPK